MEQLTLKPLHQPLLYAPHQLTHPLGRPRPEHQTVPRIDEARLVEEGVEDGVDGETAEVRGEEEGFLGGGAGEAGVCVGSLETFLCCLGEGVREVFLEEEHCWKGGEGTRCREWGGGGLLTGSC